MTPTPKTLTDQESANLLDWLQPTEGPPGKIRQGVRNYAMAVLMLDAGLRVGELVQLRQCDLAFLNTPTMALSVRAAIAKTKTERYIPLTPRIRDAIDKMMTNWWTTPIHPNGKFAFYRTKPEVPITTRQVERIIGRTAFHAINRHVHPHVLRHTFASRLMRTTNARTVQELLGHKQLSSTQIYTHPNSNDLVTAIDSLSKPAP